MVRVSREVWVGLVAALKSSGLSAVAYAKEHDLPVRLLYHWRCKLKKVSSRAGKPISVKGEPGGGFVALRVLPEASARSTFAPCTLVLHSSLRLEMAVLPDPSWLRALAQGDR